MAASTVPTIAAVVNRRRPAAYAGGSASAAWVVIR